MTNLLLIKFNNYYNRMIKKLDTTADYTAASSGYLMYKSVNFDKKNGVMTTVTLNDSGLSNGPYASTIAQEDADYLVEFDEQANILSRWFIIETTMTRLGQHRFDLRRDVIVDNYDSVLNAVTYIEKATVTAGDVAIYNYEDIEFNKIKTTERLLKDKTGTAWIVGYFAKNASDVSVSSGVPLINADIEVDDITEWTYWAYQNTPYKWVRSVRFKVLFFWLFPVSGYRQNQYVITNGNRGSESNSSALQLTVTSDYNAGDFSDWVVQNKDAIEELFYSHTTFKQQSVADLDGKVVFDNATAKYYRISISSTSNAHTEWQEPLVSSAFATGVKAKMLENDYMSSATVVGEESCVQYKAGYDNIYFTFTEIDEAASTLTVPATSNVLTDAPYKMFAIPYGVCHYFTMPGNVYIDNETMENPFAINLAMRLAETLTTDKVYDMQLLPYCPMTEAVKTIQDTGGIDLTGLTEDEDFSYVKDTGNNVIGFVLYPKESTFSVDIESTITVPSDAVEAKVVLQCNMYRLCSPNYSGIFEFNPIKTGKINVFNVDCTYKPFTPYIRIGPVWGRLYGQDFNDTRGLIIQGDFSLPIVNDRWEQYQINNKNYLNAFNREIESIELKNRYQRVSDTVNAISGTASAAASGAAMGGVGAAVGGVASLGLGIADVAINERLRRDALDLTKDQFNYSLDNIRALPRTLAKVSSFDANNKLFPVLEYYTCTDQEKDIFRNKLTYNGMTVMRIDSIGNFVTSTPQYVKGKLIRIDIDGDDHTVNAIADELNMGVYI